MSEKKNMKLQFLICPCPYRYLAILAYHAKILCSEVFHHVQFKFNATRTNIKSIGYQPVNREDSVTYSVAGISPTSSNSAQ